MKKQTKLLMNFALFMLLIVLTFYILLKDQNIFEVFDIIKSAKIEFILIGILCIAIYVICVAISYFTTYLFLAIYDLFRLHIQFHINSIAHNMITATPNVSRIRNAMSEKNPSGSIRII